MSRSTKFSVRYSITLYKSPYFVPYSIEIYSTVLINKMLMHWETFVPLFIVKSISLYCTFCAATL